MSKLSEVTIKQLLEAGVHFGHQTSRWNPKMKKYIFGERNGIYIINLEITLTCLREALAFLTRTASEGKELLFIGTKKQAQEPVRSAAESCQMPYVNQRWLGGTLTNFETIRKSVQRLENIDRLEQEGNFQFLTKKEVLVLKKEREKLNKNLMGIRSMRKLPSAIFVIDSKKEEIAIQEAHKLGIAVVAILDTNCDPDLVDYPIPGNDDAIRAIKLFCDLAAEAVNVGRSQIQTAVTEADFVSQDQAHAGAAGIPETIESPDEMPVAREEKLAEDFFEDSQITKDKESKIKPKKAAKKEIERSK
ncbi:MAG: 30S ribosomal protein S2 [Candidatus Omnitrophica bacterium]|nr:30S ribosomal protein S2 [Candidatus Omnitrophota bacterium]